METEMEDIRRLHYEVVDLKDQRIHSLNNDIRKLENRILVLESERVEFLKIISDLRKMLARRA